MKSNYSEKRINGPENADSGWQATPHSYNVPVIMNLLPKDRCLTILDVGCGKGYVTNQLAALGHSIIGIDISEDCIAIARERYRKPRFEIYSAYDDFKNLTKEVDVVIASEVIEHLFQPDIFLKNTFNILHQNGVLIITTPYHGYLKNLFLSLFNLWDKHFEVTGRGGHIKFFSRKTLAKALEDCGFKNMVYRYAGRIFLLYCSLVCLAEKPNEK